MPCTETSPVKMTSSLPSGVRITNSPAGVISVAVPGEQAIRTLCADLPSDADTKFPVILHDARYLVVPVKLKQRLEFVENSSQ